MAHMVSFDLLVNLQLDPKFLRNQRFAKKYNKKNENKSKKVRFHLP